MLLPEGANGKDERLVTILTRDEEMQLPAGRAAELEDMGLIFACLACSEDELDPDIHHLTEGHTWEDVEHALGIEGICVGGFHTVGERRCG